MVEIVGVITYRNCLEIGYPFLESILSVLPVCNKYIVNDGGSTDGTKELTERLAEVFPNKIILTNIPDTPPTPTTRWDCVSDQYNQMINMISDGDWIWMGNADELLHEKDLSDYSRILNETVTEDIIRHPRREICTNWTKLSQYSYWPARTARKFDGLNMYWPSLGGDEFRDGKNWIHEKKGGENRIKKCPILIYHLFSVFKGNIVEKWRHDAEWIAPGALHRVEIYERQKQQKYRPQKPPENPLEPMPVLCKGLVGMFKYEIREDLFNIDWLNKTTGLNYDE